MPPERELVKACIAYINARGGFAWRTNAGVLPLLAKDGRRRAIHIGKKGLPDVIGVLPTERVPLSGNCWAMPEFPLGRLIAVECKRKGKRPTPDQERVMDELRRRGALVVVAYSISDVERALA